MKSWDLNKGRKQTHLEGFFLAAIENKHENFCEFLPPFIVVLLFPPGKGPHDIKGPPTAPQLLTIAVRMAFFSQQQQEFIFYWETKLGFD
jgi:hypothetical protein